MHTVEIFPWNASFRTGLDNIDRQHEKLVGLLNMLAGHLVDQSEMPVLSEIFDELAQYSVYHFTTEENIWNQYLSGDALVLAHQEEHRKFVEDVVNLQEKVTGRIVSEVLDDVLSFLTHWLAFHILESDKRMATVVIAIQSGLSIEEAKVDASQQMSGAIKVVVESVLAMYDSLSSRTLELMKEILERQKAEAKLRLAANVFDNTLEAVCITDEHVHIIDVNPAFFQTTGYSHNEVLGKKLSEIKSGLDDEKLFSEIWNKIENQGHWIGEVRSRTKDGELSVEWLTLSSVKNEVGNVTNYVGVFTNMTALFHKQHRLEHIANYDALTELPNRLLIADRIDFAMANASRTREFLAVCYLDLDGFKPVNDRLGHAAGDLLLKEIASRLKKSVRENDTVGRLGGDEFVILLGGLKNPEDCEIVLERILNEVEQPVEIQGEIIRVSCSIGVVNYPHDRVDRDTLLIHADQAMYQAKKLGKARYCFYDVGEITKKKE